MILNLDFSNKDIIYYLTSIKKKIVYIISLKEKNKFKLIKKHKKSTNKFTGTF